jgi:CubicO group peptidase (beta-lactamase class C family)
LARTLTALLAGTNCDGRPPSGGCLAVRSPAGCSAAVAGARQVFADTGPLPERPAMTWDTALDLGSVTKIVATTTSIMVLVERGAVSLDDPVRHYVPAAQVDASLADLLYHRAGLWEWWPLYVSGAGTHLETIDLICRLPPRYRRGERHYSDLGFMLLGAVIERVSTVPLEAAVTSLVLEPLVLGATRFARPADSVPVAATSRGDWIERRMIDTGAPYPVPVRSDSFAGWRTHVLVGEANDGNAFHGCGGIAGHAGLFATVPDLLSYGRSLLASLAGSGPLQPGTVQKFTSDGSDAGQALGFRTWRSELPGCTARAFGHAGFPGVVLGVMPRHQAVIVLAVNRLHIDGGEPIPTEPAWQKAMHAAHQSLHEQELG